MQNLAYRRFTLEKKKKKSLKLYGTTKNAEHLTKCSCFMCGNPRKHFKEKTMQEKKSDDIFKNEKLNLK